MYIFIYIYIYIYIFVFMYILYLFLGCIIMSIVIYFSFFILIFHTLQSTFLLFSTSPLAGLLEEISTEISSTFVSSFLFNCIFFLFLCVLSLK